MQQARALGTSLADIPFAHIHASDLKRATATAEALQSGQTADPKPPLTRTAQIREQNFGIAEGKPWLFEMKPGKTLEEHYAEGIFPILDDSAAKYPEGESTQDLQKRAAQAIKDIVIPYVWDAARTGKREVHVALVSHGLCISKLVPALLNWGMYAKQQDYSGLKNTAWTRAEISLKVYVLTRTVKRASLTSILCRVARKGSLWSSPTPIILRSRSESHISTNTTTCRESNVRLRLPVPQHTTQIRKISGLSLEEGELHKQSRRLSSTLQAM
jgi:broad specificity phosphatase PhoE